MGTLRAFLKKIKLFVFENIYSNKINIQNDKAIFSFTFDDVPISAAVAGAKILEDAGVRGTYYVALGMESSNSEKEAERRFINEDEILALYEKDHDIGCHTFSHFNFREIPTSDIEVDCNKNTDRLMNIIKSSSIDHFAYPFGAVSLPGKKQLGYKYKTMRTTDPGLNYGSTDMSHLRTISLCNISFDRDKVLKSIQSAVKHKAWVVFFSHDICDSPSDWGTKTNDFKWVVEQCKKVDGEILNVTNAYARITNR